MASTNKSNAEHIIWETNEIKLDQLDPIIREGLGLTETNEKDTIISDEFAPQSFDFVNKSADRLDDMSVSSHNTIVVSEASITNSLVTQVASSKAYSQAGIPFTGTTGAGLDQLVKMIGGDPGLAGNNIGQSLRSGALASDGLNQIIVDAITATSVGVNGIFTTQDVLAINTWIRQNRLAQFTQLYGTDNGTLETGFRLVQNDGAITNYRGLNLVDTVVDGLYHIGFQIQNGVFLNDDR
jgi:hypothetical protein